MAIISRGINLFALPSSARVSLLQTHQLLQYSRIPSLRASSLRHYATNKPSHPVAKQLRNANKPSVIQVNARKPKTNPKQGLPRLSPSPQTSSPSAFNAFKTNSHTLVYRAPPQRLWCTCAYVSSSFLFAYGYYCILLSYATVKDMLFLKFFSGAAGFALLCGGMYIFTRTTGRLLRIVTLPVKGTGGSLQLRLEGKRWIPWRISSITVPLSDVSLSHKWSELVVPEFQGQHLPISEVSVFIRPFVRFGRWFGRFFQEMRAILTGDTLVYVYVKGHRAWKMDIRGQTLSGVKGELLMYFNAPSLILC